MKKIIFVLSVSLIFLRSSLFATEFTVSSFNCGGLSDHYDYIRAVCMHKLVQERYNVEPEEMAQLERIQKVALKILFFSNPVELEEARKEWESGKYSEIFTKLTAHPDDFNSINKIWKEKSAAIVTSYKERPVVIFDEEIRKILQDHFTDLTKGQGITFRAENHVNDWLDVTRRVMAERIFAHELRYDIIALQEADYLDPSVFPSNYDVQFSNTKHSINGVAWNKEKFELVGVIGNIVDRGFAVELLDIESGQVIAVASGHLSGCNPFQMIIDENTGISDSSKGDKELQEIIEALQSSKAEIKIIAMDSNVTAMHPRLSLLKEAGYGLDSQKYLDSTCTNPHQVINTRIDWIAVQSLDTPVKIHNIPVLGVGLNSPQTNISDHKPIAAKLFYSTNSNK